MFTGLLIFHCLTIINNVKGIQSNPKGFGHAIDAIQIAKLESWLGNVFLERRWQRGDNSILGYKR